MTFFKKLFAGKKSQARATQLLPDEVAKVIYLLRDADFGIDDDQFVKLLVNHGIHRDDAIEMLLFLPIAFVRQWLTEVPWLDTYIEYFSEGKQITRKFSETTSYQIIQSVTERYFQNSPDKDVVMKIGGRSAEFNVINQLLNNNPEANLKEITLTPTVIIR